MQLIIPLTQIELSHPIPQEQQLLNTLSREIRVYATKASTETDKKKD